MLEYGLAALFAAFVAWPSFLPGRRLLSFDGLAYSGPNVALSTSNWRAGRIPQWNDTVFGGVPHLANPQAGVFYPLKFLFLWADPAQTLTLVTIVHLLLLAVGMVVLVRGRLGLRAPAGLVASVAVVGSGMVMARSLQFEQFVVVAWAPWLLAAIDWLVAEPHRTRWALPATAIVAATLVSGAHPQGVFILMPAATIWAVARAADRSQFGRLPLVLAAGALGALLAAPHLLPAALFFGEGAQSRGRSLSFLSQPGYLLQLKRLPDTLLGSVFSPNQAFMSGGFESTTSIGAAVATLALLGGVIALRRCSSERWTILSLSVIGVVACVLALGPRTILFRIAFRTIPLFDLARVSARWRDLTVLSAAILAGYGVDAIRTRKLGRSAFAFAVVVILSLASGFLLTPLAFPGWRTALWWLAIAISCLGAACLGTRRFDRSVAAGVCVVLVLVELGLMAPHNYFRAYSIPEALGRGRGNAAVFLSTQRGRVMVFTAERLGEPKYILDGLRPNANTPLGIRSIDGYDGGVQVTRQWAETVSAVANDPFDSVLTLKGQLRTPLDPQLFARLGVEWLLLDSQLLPRDVLIPQWEGPVMHDGTLEVWRNPAYRGEARIYASTRRVPSGTTPGRFLRDRQQTLLDDALVEDDGPVLQCLGECSMTTARLDRIHPGALNVRATTRRRSLIVVDEQWDRGWEATLDGRRVAVARVDGMFLGVETPAGDHVLNLRYRAPGLRFGLGLSGLTGLFLLVFALPRRRVLIFSRLQRPASSPDRNDS